MDIDELEALISQLPNSDLNAYEYLHVEDEMPEGGLTDFEIVDTIRNADKEEEDMMDETEFTPISEKGPEFGDVNEELKVLRKLHKKITSPDNTNVAEAAHVLSNRCERDLKLLMAILHGQKLDKERFTTIYVHRI
ncbi:hypothetical protein RhiirA5_403087 [Rhizophagus irregularis]|uniref:Uncharacterized protein n=1 Tax=Rhizophagus irregularis TaxID=588596 RepID=A0A2N0P1Z7_9GLOM|nr:hypothetical protein RhiirA5_403087 [Rhizophagus irregularis]